MGREAMTDEKEYPIPGEVADIMEEAIGAENLRDIYVEEWFGFKKALRCSKIAATNRMKFWAKVYELYPDIRGVTLSYDRASKTITKGAAAE
jgi:hypothetical protein